MRTQLPSVTFEIGGRKVERHSVRSPEEEDALDRVAESIYSKLSGLVCPQHRKRPSIHCVGDTPDSVRYYVSGCCQTLIDDAQRRLNAA